ncbi:hypothetical protein [Streptacidiphilus sp. PAMC 29251]
MDIIYTSLERRDPAAPDPVNEVAEVLDALWAHATAEDGLEYAGGNAGPGRLDLLLFLLTPPPDRPPATAAIHRAAQLLNRCHRASPMVRHRYLPPAAQP